MCVSHLPTLNSLEGSGCCAHPCHLSLLPFVTTSHSSGLWPQPPGPSPGWTFRRAHSWRGAPHLLAAGHLVSSAWNVTRTYTRKHSRMPTHMHTNPRVPTHTPHVHTCLCAHTRLSTHAHPRAHTHPHTHAVFIPPAFWASACSLLTSWAETLRSAHRGSHPHPVFLPPHPSWVFLCHCRRCQL